MSKKGFTLVELLVVVAIIGVLSLIIVPSVIKVNSGINERLYNGKVENIESSAVLYASNNEDIFNGQDEVIIYVYELINSGYLTVDVKTGSNNSCTSGSNGSAHEAEGCIIDPRVSGTSASLNGDYVKITKSGAGFVAVFVHLGDIPESSKNNGSPIVDLICSGFEKGKFVGQTIVDGKTEECKCNSSGNDLITKKDSRSVSYCMISGENPNNYLRYGDTKANWRVLGLYKLDNKIYAKMITNEPI